MSPSILTIFNKVYVIICSIFDHQLKTIHNENSLYHYPLRCSNHRNLRNPFLLSRVKRLPRQVLI